MKTLLLCFAPVVLAASASAQFSISSGAGDTIPGLVGSTGSNLGWDSANMDNDLTLAVTPGTASISIFEPVTNVDSVVIAGFEHTWIGDTMGVLRDPNGVGHIIWIRPGVRAGTSGAGNGANAELGTYTFVEAGFVGSNGVFPGVTVPSIPAGLWDQSLDSDGAPPTVWPDGDEMIFNTPLSDISGPAGVWTFSIYDFAGGDIGAFTNFTLNGNGGDGVGTPFCAPANNSTGSPTVLTGQFGSGVGSGLHLDMTGGVPGELAYMLVGSTNVGSVTPPGSPSALCLAGGAFYRYNVSGTSGNSIGGFNASGVWVNAVGTSTTGLGFDVPTRIPTGPTIMIMAGHTWHFQGWHRDTPAGPGSSNFSNGLGVTF